MFNLIKNEFIKISKQKYLYIILAIIIGMFTILLILGKTLDKKFNENNVFKKFQQEQLKTFEGEITKDTSKEKIEEIRQKWTEINVENLKYNHRKSLGQDWQKNALEIDYDNYQENINKKANLDFDKKVAKLQKKENPVKDDDYQKILDQINQKIKKIKNSSQSEYLEYLAKNNQKQIEAIQKDKAKIAFLNTIKQKIDLRKKYKIYFDDKNLSQAIEDYFNAQEQLKNTEKHKSGKEKATQISKLKKDIALNEYMIKNKQSLTTSQTAYGNVINFHKSFKFLLIILAVSYAATMIGEEFSKGTIKSLLLLPKSRYKIFFSKLISVTLMTFLLYFVSLILFTLISGIVQGFDSLTWNVPVWDKDSQSLTIYNLFSYAMIAMTITLPEILVFTIFAFSCSTIFANTSIGITLGIVSNVGLGIFNSILLMVTSGKNLEWVKYIPTLNWNWSFMLQSATDFSGFGSTVERSITTSIIITILTYLILLLPTVIIFKNKNIKNV